MTKYPTGVAGVYSGGVIWGVRRHDVGDQPVIYQMEGNPEQAERNARAMVSRINDFCDERGTPERKAELLATRIHWVVQE